MLKVLATTVGVGIVATAFIANAQMQMPRQGQMPEHMRMDMGEHGQMHMAGPNHMTEHAPMQDHAQLRQERAQMRHEETGPAPLAAVPLANAVSPVPVVGEVVRIDEANGRITLRHEPIPNLDMRAMTMVLRLDSPLLTAGLKTGDKVTFEATRVDGAITVIRLEKTATN